MPEPFARPRIPVMGMGLLLAWAAVLPCAAQTTAPAPPANATPGPVPRLAQVQGDTTRPGGPAARPVIPPPRRVQTPDASTNPAQLTPIERNLLLESGLNLKPAPLERTDLKFPINLATALRLSDARPLIVAAAQAGVWVAEAQLTRAKVVWVPSFDAGADYIRHDGGGPDFNKGVMTAPSVNFFYGGAGLDKVIALTDAFYEPLIARQVLNARHFDIQTAKNDALLATADAYFRVHQSRGMYAAALYCVERGHDLVERIAQLSRELVPRDEVDRAQNMLADIQQKATSAREFWRVNSADLTQVLRLDPRAVVVPLEPDQLQLTLIDPAMSLKDMMKIAITNRPELGSNRALVQAAQSRVQREKMRPVLPVVLLNGFQSAGMLIQAGFFGLGPNTSLNQWAGRVDVSVQLVWQLEGFGLGNMARIKQQRGAQSDAIVELFNAQDRVVAEVTAANARLQSAAARVGQAHNALRTGIITFNGNYEGLRQTTRFGDVLVLVYRPQEAVYALELMLVAYNEYFMTVAQYNRAQFELFHALGYPGLRDHAHAAPWKYRAG